MPATMTFSIVRRNSDIKMNLGKSNFDTQVVKIDIDFKQPIDVYKPVYYSFIPNPNKHACRINREVPQRKISTSLRPWQGPQTLTLKRDENGYGFSLRYFIVYPPALSSPSPSPSSSHEKGFNRNSYWADRGLDGSENTSPTTLAPPPLDTFFVKNVDTEGPAEKAGLKSGDRIVSVNGDLIGGKVYKDVVELIQYCTGDLKLGVVPRNEDILQLVYEEYVYDGSTAVSSSDINNTVRRNSNNSNMQQPSINKWSVPILSRKSASFDSNGNNLNLIPDNSEKKHEPCVQFIAGRTVQDGSKSSRSNSVSSSGSMTPLQRSGKMSPGSRGSNSNFDPCVSFIAGKPQVVPNNESPTDEKRTSGEAENIENDIGIQPQKLQYALRKEIQKKGYSVGTRLAPKPIAGVSKPGAVSNIAGLFASGNLDELSSSSVRKKSATSVLRDDFQIRKNKSAQLTVDKTNTSRRGNNLSSITSQATLVESRTKGIAALVNNTLVLSSDQDGHLKRHNKNSPGPQRKRTLLKNGRKTSISSSVENSEEEEDSHMESADESGLDNWKGRRVSYLVANANKKEKQGKKHFDHHMEADDEDSDTNSSKKYTGQRSQEEVKPIIKEGPLNRKLERSLDRKKPSQRTWKPIYAVLKGHRLFCYKEGGSDADDEIIQPIPVRSSIIEIANDYAKRKHVFRMVTSHGNIYLFQAEDAAKMVIWVNTLRDANPDKESLMKSTAIIKQEKMEEHDNSGPPKMNRKEDNKKGISLRRSHFGLRGSKKGRSSNTQPRVPKQAVVGKTFGKQLKDCPPSLHIKNVPRIVEHCCSAIEQKGIDTIGIYRVPGNATAVQALQRELDEKDPADIDWTEERWYEINNISSLLKSFLRRLSEPIVPNDMYSKLIQANRIQIPFERLKTMKYLVKSLPEYHYETLELLVHHLKTLSDNAAVNKMDPKNLAIVFGPNVVRTSTDASMVQNMPDQCRIIETLLKQCDWMFSDEDNMEPINFEHEATEVISAGVSKVLMECYNNQQSTIVIETSDNNTNEVGPKKGGKLSTLKSNLSMKLRSTGTKVVSPKSLKKSKQNAAPDDNETDDDTSGFNSQSPPTTKNEKKFRLNTNSNFPIRRTSDDNVVTTKLGSFQQNAEFQLQFSTEFRSPEVSPQLAHTKDFKHDDGNDSGVTSPQRMDSDDNGSVYSDSGALSSRKESLDSLSGPSPRIERRGILPRQHSAGSNSNDEMSPTLQKSSFIVTPNCPSVKEEKEPMFVRRDVTRNSSRKANTKKGDSSPSQPVVKRSDVIRRRAANFSPRASKRELYSIMPGDGNDYEEKILALLEPEHTGDTKEQEQTEVFVAELADTSPDSPFSPDPFSPTGGYNADWWLSGNQNIPKRMVNSPKDKNAALNIITSALGSKNRQRNFSDSHEQLKNMHNDDAELKRNPILSPTIVRRAGLQAHNPGLSRRVDDYNQKREEHQKKMNNILSNNKTESTINKSLVTPQKSSINLKPSSQTSEKIKAINDLRSPKGKSSTLSESKISKLDRYLQQVTELLSESEVTGDEREKINSILKNFQTAHEAVDQKPRRLNSEKSNSRQPPAPHPNLHRSKSGPMIKSRDPRIKNRTSPLLDDTYSNLNYSKLYPR